MTTEADVSADAVTLPVEKEKAEMPMSPRGGRNGDREGLDEATLDTSEMSYFFGQAIFGGAMMAVGHSTTTKEMLMGSEKMRIISVLMAPLIGFGLPAFSSWSLTPFMPWPRSTRSALSVTVRPTWGRRWAWS